MKKISQNIYVRTLTESDAEALVTLERENRTYFQQFTPLVQDDFLLYLVKRNGLTAVCKGVQKMKPICTVFS